jgi:hypothetical protein
MASLKHCGTTRPVRAGRHDLVVSGLDRIELVGTTLLRFVLFVSWPDEIGPGSSRLPAELDIVMPVEAVPDAIGKTMLAVGRQIFVTQEGEITLAM